MAEALEGATAAEQTPVPSFESSNDRSGEQISPAGNHFDAESNKFIDKSPREDQGRFAKVRESLARAQQKASFVQAVTEGLVDPDENTMDADTWAAARNAQIARGTGKIQLPDVGEGAEEGAIADIEAHPNRPELPKLSEFMGTIEEYDRAVAEYPAKLQAFMNAERQVWERLPPISPEHENLVLGLQASAESPEVAALEYALDFVKQNGAQPRFHYDLGRFASECPNGEQVLLHFGAHPEKLVKFFAAAVQNAHPAECLQKLVHTLSGRLEKDAAHQARSSKPRPPEPVGARATSSAFDVNDENTPTEEWTRRRNEQLAKRTRR